MIKISRTKVNLWLMSSFLFFLYTASCNKAPNKETSEGKYDVAAYIWPAYHDEDRSRENLWPQGIGEWEIIKKANRISRALSASCAFWGYEMEDDPAAMEKKIKAATDHGINVFIFDWYWYEGKPFLEEALNEGFLKSLKQ
jgi:hypothetical protein